MTGESDPFFTPEELEEDFDPLLEDEDTSRRTMLRLDLGPRVDSAKHEIGPTTPEEEDFFEDADEPRYIDKRPSTGVHCMDDNVTDPGMQVPGGLLETWAASRVLNPQLSDMTRSELYARSLNHLLRYGDQAIWVHGKVCAAATGMRDALLATSSHSASALEFTGVVMEALKLNHREDDAKVAILTGYDRASKDKLWDIDFSDALGYTKNQPGVNYEEFDPKHRAAGLRIDVSEEGNLFNNALFRREHITRSGEEIGLLSVTLSAYKGYLFEQGLRGKHLAREIMRTALYTFGMAKIAGHDYMPVALIKSGTKEV